MILSPVLSPNKIFTFTWEHEGSRLTLFLVLTSIASQFIMQLCSGALRPWSQMDLDPRPHTHTNHLGTLRAVTSSPWASASPYTAVGYNSLPYHCKKHYFYTYILGTLSTLIHHEQLAKYLFPDYVRENSHLSCLYFQSLASWNTWQLLSHHLSGIQGSR